MPLHKWGQPVAGLHPVLDRLDAMVNKISVAILWHPEQVLLLPAWCDGSGTH